MTFGLSVVDIFIIKHTQFGQDAFGYDISIVHCLLSRVIVFFVDTVHMDGLLRY